MVWNIILIIGVVVCLILQYLVIRKVLKSAECERRACDNRSNLLAMLAHDIKTPLNCIMGNADLALVRTKDEGQAELLKRVKNAGNELLLLVNEVLSFDEIESGRFKIYENKVNIGELIDDINNAIVFLAEDKKLRFHIGFDDMEHMDFITDKGKMQRICINLLSNAIKYTDAGGEVMLNFREERDEKGTFWLCISVKDTGIGMSKEDKAKMYELYQCKESSFGKNHGVGLYIVKNMVEILSGTIDCESACGVGTGFYVRIPVNVTCK